MFGQIDDTSTKIVSKKDTSSIVAIYLVAFPSTIAKNIATNLYTSGIGSLTDYGRGL